MPGISMKALLSLLTLAALLLLLVASNHVRIDSTTQRIYSCVLRVRMRLAFAWPRPSRHKHATAAYGQNTHYRVDYANNTRWDKVSIICALVKRGARAHADGVCVFIFLHDGCWHRYGQIERVQSVFARCVCVHNKQAERKYDGKNIVSHGVRV